jgi:hypothetical protein
MVAAHTSDVRMINRPKMARSSCGSGADIMPPFGRQASGPESILDRAGVPAAEADGPGGKANDPRCRGGRKEYPANMQLLL